MERKSGDGAVIQQIGRTSGEGEGEGECAAVIEGCLLSACGVSGSGSSGGGLCTALGVDERLVVNGTSSFAGCSAPSTAGNKGKGGAVIIAVMDSSASFELHSILSFSTTTANNAWLGKDVLVSCGNGILLAAKITSSTLCFFNPLSPLSDVQLLCGSEDGKKTPMIPLHVYLCTVSSPLLVRGDAGVDHTHCGLISFECASVDFCVEHRVSAALSAVEISAQSELRDELAVSAHPLALTSQTSGMVVTVTVAKGKTQPALILCSQPTTVINLSLSLSQPSPSLSPLSPPSPSA